MSQNQAQTLGLQRPQRQEFDTINFTGAGSYRTTLNCSFPVKELHIRTAYTVIANTAPMTLVASMPTLVPEGTVVATMNNLNSILTLTNEPTSTVRSDTLPGAPVVGPNTLFIPVYTPNVRYIYSGNLDDSSGIRYIFRDPRFINGTYDIIVIDLLGAGGAVTAASLLMHFEFLG